MVLADFLTVILIQNLSPVRFSISYFAGSPYGWLEKIGMVAVSISFALIAANLLCGVEKPAGRLWQIDGVLLAVVAVGFLTISLFDTNVIGTIYSFHGLVHQLATIAVTLFFMLPVCFLCGCYLCFPVLGFGRYIAVSSVFSGSWLCSGVAGRQTAIYTWEYWKG